MYRHSLADGDVTVDTMTKPNPFTPTKAFFETPTDGDRILILFKDHRLSWDGPFFYRDRLTDPEKGEVHRTCVYVEGGNKEGQLAHLFEDVEFWQNWEGESLQEYEVRRLKIIEDLKRQKLPIDPIDSFFGANAIQGYWSKPRIGPAFQPVPLEGTWTRPEDNAMIEVHAIRKSETKRGRYSKAADALVPEEPLIAKRTVRAGPGDFKVSSDMTKSLIDHTIQGDNIETLYSDKTRYFPPSPPFAEWIQFRTVNGNGTPNSEWKEGPHYDEWALEDLIRRTNEKFDKNQKRFEELQLGVTEFLQRESFPPARLIRLQDLIANVSNSGFDLGLDRETLQGRYDAMLQNSEITKEQYDTRLRRIEGDFTGGGAYFRDRYTEFLTREANILERALTLVLEPQTVAAAIEPTPPLAFSEAWIQGESLIAVNEYLLSCKLIRRIRHEGKDIVVWEGKAGEFGHVVDFLIESSALNSPPDYKKIAAGMYWKEEENYIEHDSSKVKKDRENARNTGKSTPSVERFKLLLQSRLKSRAH